MLWGIAYCENGGHPTVDKVIGWKQNEKGEDETWDTREAALEANDLSGWCGYVCEYPSGVLLKP